MAQYGVPAVSRRLPRDYDDEDAPYTPAWQEKYTGIGRKDLISSPGVGQHGRAPKASARSSSVPASTTGTTPT